MALVRKTDADVYLQEYASIFMYEPASRMLIWGCYNRQKKHWELHKNGKLVATGHAPLVHADDVCLLTHYEMLCWMVDQINGRYEVKANPELYITVRISPDRSTIYINTRGTRPHHTMIERMWPTHTKNALHKINMYMKEQITEARVYNPNPLSASSS